MAEELAAPPSKSPVSSVLYASQVIDNILLLVTIGFDSESIYLKLEAHDSTKLVFFLS
jgi:hypothetical protein